MLRSAEDARKLANRSGGGTQSVPKAITDLIQEKIQKAAQNGLSQVTVEMPYRLYKAVDIDVLKESLKEAGYSYISGGIDKGLLGKNIFTEAKYCITIMW